VSERFLFFMPSINIKKSTLVMLCLFVVYLLAVVFDVRGGNFSGDEIAYLSGFESRGQNVTIDHRYILWIYYIANTAEIYRSLPLLINAFVLVYLLKLCLDLRIFSLLSAVSLGLLPSLFYFFNGYLRDVVFILFSLMIIIFVGKINRVFWWKIFIIIAFFAVLSMRPIYGVIFLLIYVFSSEFYARYFKVLLYSLAIIFVLLPVVIYVDHDLFNLYWDFFKFGNLRGKDAVGVLMIPVGEFDQLNAALNFLLSPLYFWYIPPKGFGRVYDVLLLCENLVFLCLTLVGVVRFRMKFFCFNRLYRMSVLALLLSFFMAAVTTVHLDIYRFRLIFIPFLFYFSNAGVKTFGFSGRHKSDHLTLDFDE